MKNIIQLQRNHVASLFLTFSCILLLTSCEKDPYKNGEPTLPPITMEGKNTLGFLLDGKVWVPYQENPGLFTPTLEAVLDRNTFRMVARQKRKNQQSYQSSSLIINNINIGKFQIPPPPFSGYIFTDQNKEGYGCNYFKCNPEDTEINIINFDREIRIVSGTFFYKNATNSCGDTIQITDGRFDVRY